MSIDIESATPIPENEGSSVPISSVSGPPGISPQPQERNVGNVTVGHTEKQPFDFVKISIIIPSAIVCICAVPTGYAISGGKVFPTNSFTIIVICYILMIWLSFPQSWGFRKRETGSSESTGVNIYRKSQTISTLYNRVISVSWMVLAQVGVVITWWLALNISVPMLRKQTLLDVPLWRWSFLAFTVPAAYIAALFLCFFIFEVIETISKSRRILTNLYLFNGVFPNMVLVCFFGIILGTWVGYFRTERGLKEVSTAHPEAFRYVTSICITLFVGSILWFLKTYILLDWSARVIYRRFEARIMMATVSFLYLSLIAEKFFMPAVVSNLELLKEYARHPDSEKHSFHKYIMSKHVDTAYLYRASQYLTSLAKNVIPLQDQGLTKERESITPTSDDICELDDLVELIHCEDLSDEKLKEVEKQRKYRFLYPLFSRRITIPINPDNLPSEDYRKNIAGVLYRIVLEQFPAKEHKITFKDLKRWMVGAHLNCVNMGRTLTDATTMVDRLDMIISVAIYVIGVLLWLLISGIATTEILVTIVTPFLAFTFVFGESAKLFFQGIVFCFGVQHFYVGDRCILEDTELEVEKMCILTTTFVKIGTVESGTVERRLYPNSLLATKAIVNYGRVPDPSDTMELTLKTTKLTEQWDILKTTLERFFKDDKQKEYFEHLYEVTMEEIGNEIKVIIHFKHVLNVEDMTHGQCSLKKRKQRPIILEFVENYRSTIDQSNTLNLWKG